VNPWTNKTVLSYDNDIGNGKQVLCLALVIQARKKGKQRQVSALAFKSVEKC
jgi:hypothetical protein